MESMKRTYVVCIRGDADSAFSLTAGKIYRTLPDGAAAKYGLLRVIDDSQEDYLYPATRFVPIELPEAAEQALYATA